MWAIESLSVYRPFSSLKRGFQAIFFFQVDLPSQYGLWNVPSVPSVQFWQDHSTRSGFVATSGGFSSSSPQNCQCSLWTIFIDNQRHFCASYMKCIDCTTRISQFFAAQCGTNRLELQDIRLPSTQRPVILAGSPFRILELSENFCLVCSHLIKLSFYLPQQQQII